MLIIASLLEDPKYFTLRETKNGYYEPTIQLTNDFFAKAAKSASFYSKICQKKTKICPKYHNPEIFQVCHLQKNSGYATNTDIHEDISVLVRCSYSSNSMIADLSILRNLS